MATIQAGIDLDSVEYHQDTGTHRAVFDTATDPTMAVVTAVATVSDVDPIALDPLYESIDSDALEDLLDPTAVGPVRVSFTYEGYGVTVTSGGQIELSPQDEPPRSVAD